MSYDLNRRKRVTKSHYGNASAPVIGASRDTYDVVGQLRKQEMGTTFAGTAASAWQTTKDVL